MDMMKIQWFNKKRNVKQEGRFYRLMREETAEGNKDGFVTQVDNLCKKYNLPSVMYRYLRPVDISEAVNRLGRFG